MIASTPVLITRSLFLGAHLVGRVADQGLANLVGLSTLRHGTNPLSWLSIHTFGAMPSMGASSIGGDYGRGFDGQNRGRFYFSQDTSQHYVSLWDRRVKPRMLPKEYSVTSTSNLLQRLGLNNKIAINVSPCIAGLIPTIKFRLSPDKVRTFRPDHSIFNGFACSTDQYLSPLNIGIVGTVWNSLTYKTPINMFNNPWRVITGIAQLALTGAVVYAAIQYMPAVIVANKTAIIAGAVLAMI